MTKNLKILRKRVGEYIDSPIDAVEWRLKNVPSYAEFRALFKDEWGSHVTDLVSQAELIGWADHVFTHKFISDNPSLPEIRALLNRRLSWDDKDYRYEQFWHSM